MDGEATGGFRGGTDGGLTGLGAAGGTDAYGRGASFGGRDPEGGATGSMRREGGSMALAPGLVGEGFGGGPELSPGALPGGRGAPGRKGGFGTARPRPLTAK